MSEPTKLRGSRRSNICAQCEDARIDAGLEVAQDELTIEWQSVAVEEKNRLEGHLRILKRDIVAQKLGGPGNVRKDVEEIRGWWGITSPPEELPPESHDVLLPPPLQEPKELSELLAVWSKHPYEIAEWPEDWDDAYQDLKDRWLLDLLLLLMGCVPEKYWLDPIGDKLPELFPQVSARLLPWLRFASALVLYDVPVEKANSFAEYGGLPTGLAEDKPMLDVLTERQLREKDTEHALSGELSELIAEKVWEKRQELDSKGTLDYVEASSKLFLRFVETEEIAKDLEQLREHLERELDAEPLHRYYIAVDPRKDSESDMLRAYRAICRKSGHEKKKDGALPQGMLPAVRVARLLQKGYSKRDIMDKTGLKESSINNLDSNGRELLEEGH